MIEIEQLRYVRLGTHDLGASTHFAQRTLGLELIEETDAQAAFRSDYRDHTLVFTTDDDGHTIGLELRDQEALERAADALSQAGCDVGFGTTEQSARRKVKTFISFKADNHLTVDLVVRPLHSGWRYFPSRDAGITGLEAVAIRSASIEKAEDLWTRVLSGRVSDWVGDAAYIRFDQRHHRIALHPSASGGVLAVEFAVEDIDLLMQNSYFLEDQQIRIVHGPGRRPSSEQMFLTFQGPENVLYSFVAEGREVDEKSHRPRQFPNRLQSFCAWGSRSSVPEFVSAEDSLAWAGGQS
jgi:2,3-dihydroxy-p-cumate/2,3-dihydroxybenzoate 3,4-dioxygenase